ncbi:pentatricopeptide repeat-containing protein At2g06000-like [Macadamia integrifolia]|uniref:pentatricopeptide repeat-containing protein At2g06000-like n=1 Tax=Macadamia integrifolia TaxID=60698 RepID=UPI001C50074C|nr:pentatricopeptide repeat-containing protein At2g06000-like [Macadamia integrifolia]XP_042515322.1 pentatricopeptide repeat-containing protein At2g06000-like [Macadamia integrifolia]XP_042515329.1 pentatricopeptide repeat-containing protein At2g06000-like [Macadamia integrifolia]
MNSDHQQKSDFKSGQQKKRISCKNGCRDLSYSSNGFAFQMTFLFFSTCRLRLRVADISIARFHDHAFRGPRHGEIALDRSDAWVIKVVYTLCVRSSSIDSCLHYFSKVLNPSITYGVIKRLNDPKLALKLFELSRVKLELNHSVNTYNFLVKSLCQVGLHDAAKLVFDCMRSDGYSPDGFILGFLVSSCSQAGKFNISKELLIQAQGIGRSVNPYACNKLLDFLVKSNQVDEAVCFFRELSKSCFCPDTCTFNILIKGLCRLGEVNKAFEFFNNMGNFGCCPDVVTYNTLINGLCRTNELDRGHGLLKEILSKQGCSPDVVTYTSVISGYCKLGRMEEASNLLDEMVCSGTKPNLITYNVIIDGFGKAGDMESAAAIYDEMLLRGCLPDVVTFSSLIDGYCRSGQVDQGLKLWHEMGNRSLCPNEYTFAILINALCKENRLHEAREFLSQLKWRNINPQPFMYNPVIDGFCKAGNVDEANSIVAEMKEKQCKPDKLTFTILIIGHCVKGRIAEAISIFHKMSSTGCIPDSITINSLISCLVKAGMPNEANQIVLTLEKNFGLGLSSSRKAFAQMAIPVAL